MVSAINLHWHNRLLRHWQQTIKYTQYIMKFIKNKNKKSYEVTVPAKTLHTASLTYTQLFFNKSIPYLQPIAINLFWWCSLDSAYSIELFEQCILYQIINLRWSTGKDIGSVLQKNWRGLVLSLQQHEKIRRKQLFQATLTLCRLLLANDHTSQPYIRACLVVGLSPSRVRWNGTRFQTLSGTLFGVLTVSDRL